MSTESLNASPGALPASIVQSIAIANANAIGEQPALLANLALAEQVFTANLRQQNAVALQQALNQLSLAVVGRCVNLILNVSADSATQVKPVLDSLLPLLERLHGVPATPAASAPPVAPT